MFKKSRGRYSIRSIHNKSLFDSENFSSFAKFAFQNKRPLSKSLYSFQIQKKFLVHIGGCNSLKNEYGKKSDSKSIFLIINSICNFIK